MVTYKMHISNLLISASNRPYETCSILHMGHFPLFIPPFHNSELTLPWHILLFLPRLKDESSVDSLRHIGRNIWKLSTAEEGC